MNTTQLLEFHKQFCESTRAIMQGKNHDYSGSSGETPFANFEVSQKVGVCGVAEGFLVRMLDKFMRINTFAKSGKLMVPNESVVDACKDISNYAILLAAWIETEQKITKAKDEIEKQYENDRLKDRVEQLRGTDSHSQNSVLDS